MGNPAIANEFIGRYSELVLNQKARDPVAMERHYYVAGEKLDGSVIQHCPGTEILVIDFKKDKYLRKFYEDTIANFELENANGTNVFELQVYFLKKIREVMDYDQDLVIGLLNGNTQEKFKNDPNLIKKYRVKGVTPETIRGIKHCQPLKDEKFYLGEYLRMHFGICRQQAAVFAACMERAIQEKKAPAHWRGVELRANFTSPTAGHAWVTLLHISGKEFNYDPVSGQMFPSGKPAPWDYELGYENHRFGEPGTWVLFPTQHLGYSLSHSVHD